MAGRVSGPSGAAAKLGIPGSTLDSKIRSLKIDKNRFKSATSPDRSRLKNFPLDSFNSRKFLKFREFSKFRKLLRHRNPCFQYFDLGATIAFFQIIVGRRC